MARNFVLLHGGGQGSWVWAETIAALRQQAGDAVRILALDVPGCGTKRGRPTDAIEVPEIVAELIGDIERAGIEDAVLVGHSQAGTILPRLIAARPERFSRVIYVSCVAPVGGQTVLTWQDGMPEADSAYQPAAGDMRARYRAMFCNDMNPAQAEAFLSRLGPDGWPASSYRFSGWEYAHLGGLPGSYVLCLRDATLVPAWQEIFAQRLCAANIVRLDAGHQAMNTRPQALAEILLREAEV